MKYRPQIDSVSVPSSPSTRREWIEIQSAYPAFVALDGLPPHGGSGLKWQPALSGLPAPRSPSTRREWIEIIIADLLAVAEIVSLHTEGVD